MSAMTVLAVPSLQRSALADLRDSPKVIVDEAWQIVNRDYVDGTFNRVDWQATRQQLLSRDYTSKEQAYEAIAAALATLDDPYTRFMDPEQFSALRSQTSGELSGIGVRLKVDRQTNILTVAEPIEDSPAFKAGIQAGDQLLAIDGKSTEGMSVESASKLIRGEAGKPVQLRLRRANRGEFELRIDRAQIELPTVYAYLRKEGNHNIGYIRLADFSSHASSQMRRAINNLKRQGVDAFVLDLRGNPGGLLYASIEISRMWMNSGAIVRTVDRGGKGEEIRANQTALTDLPLAVLVDGNSASSSEILTGALKDNRRAIVVGSKTFGKALVQSVRSLSDGSGIAVTIAHYYTPNGTDISKKGITPDVLVDLSSEQQQFLGQNPELIGTWQDPQYLRAVMTLRATALANPAQQANNQPNR
ncbi:MAG: S41 family peptidase [Cyanobacteriota bacterium SKYGB_h_bin112]|nr:S41 family peptidase [Cyanobacteriota bacterium SKYGB_h_bin112]